MEARKLPVRFPEVTLNLIEKYSESLGMSTSEISRAAMLLGIHEVIEIIEAKGVKDAEALLSCLSGTGNKTPKELKFIK